MEITLYKYSGEMDNATKSNYLSSPLTINGTLREESSIINPSITFNINNFDLQNYNYAYIKEFNRYYFIKDITYIRNSIGRIDFNVDVLYTYWNKATINGMVERNQYTFNPLIKDDFIKFSQKANYTILHEFETVLNSSVTTKGNVVLTIVNGIN